ncbi:hypothetical protein AGR3A_Cc190074 [Agrobacterium tomkonis CFBP 6623]|uniref:Uncharacterized protein n=1 Tax=Agrobacterium tomkonis CFBP 6623 TaxID=1183432 RepID=A0A1S7P121_9HYPH|nr:hypothetical protein AGR3A_Cc190074 [Agrobacterium tomkonis CFBP 6623]
MLDIAAIGM